MQPAEPVSGRQGAATPAAAPDPAATPAAALPLRRNRDFLLLLAGEGVSSVGDAVTFTAMPLLVLALTGSGLLMGVVGALQTVPDLLFGLLAGAVADRWDRRRLMLFSDAGRAVLTALIPLSAWLHLPTMGVVLLVVGPINLLRVLWMAGWTAAVPSLVDRRQIGPAQSVFEVAFNLAFVLGPGIAGVLVTTIGPAATMAVDATSFLASVVALAVIRHPLRSTERTAETHILQDIREGLVFLRRQRLLRVAAAFWTLNGLGSAALIPALTYYVTIDRGLAAADLGAVLSAFGAGALGGALVAMRLTRGPLGPLLLGGNLVQSLLLLTITLDLPVPAMALLALVAGVAAEQVAVAYVTIRATVTPDELLGRIGAATRSLSVGMQPLGLLAGGILLDAVHGAITLRVMGLFLVAMTLAFSLSGTMRAARAAR